MPSDLAPGDYTVPVVATDDGTPPQSTGGAVAVHVVAVQPPSFGPFDPISESAGQTVSLDLGNFATDENTPALPLSYTLAAGPTGAEVDATSGRLTWAIPSDQPTGLVTIMVDASDRLTTADPTKASITIDVQRPPSRRSCSRRSPRRA